LLSLVLKNGRKSTPLTAQALLLSPLSFSDNLICSHNGTTMNVLKPIQERPTMSTADTYVRARIDTITKQRAADALEAMGLSISDAIRLLMLRIADERRLPFDVKVPNATTRKAIAELEAGKGKRFASVDDLMADLHADD
jgi:DNA-damage-inducible protein J